LAKQAKEGAQPEKSKFLGLVQKELRSTNLWKPDFAEKEEWVLGTATTIAERYSTLTDFSVRGRAYFDDTYDTEPRASENLDKDDVRELLRELAERLAANPEFTEESVERELRSLAEERGVKPGLLINGSRAALTGQSVGPSAFQVFRWIGREKSIQRLRNV
jgi:glutamyl-tRNA synthetase